VDDRDPSKPGQGFTHQKGDEVVISSQKLGTLVNWVDHCDRIPPWDFGICDLVNSLHSEHNEMDSEF
jgi:fumarylacetoacetate (FAA) hydrolase family protein